MWRADHVTAELRRRGELFESAPGLIALRGDALTLFNTLDRALAEIADEADDWRVPPALPLEVLADADYFASFPQWLTVAAHLSSDNDVLGRVAEAEDPIREVARAVEPPRIALQPAVCYHVYAAHRGRVLADAVCVTCAGTCWRHEGARLTPLERGWAFTMREIVQLGSAADAAAFRTLHTERMVRLAHELGLEPMLAPATDPFFASQLRGRTLLQKLKGLKEELLLPLGDGRFVAAGSCNDHEQFFGTAFDIHLPDGEPAASSCIAFGIERWTLAFLVAHGVDARNWPRVRGLRSVDQAAATEPNTRSEPAAAPSRERAVRRTLAENTA